MAITKEQKADILNDLVDKFSRSKSVVFSDYRGLDVAGIQDLRGRLREKGAEAKVAKKTLMKLAAEKNNLPKISDDILAGPVAVTFSYEDELSGLQILFRFSKENENLKLLGGIIDGKVMGAEEITELAKLPSREELLAKMIGSMNAPISGFVGIMSNLISGFVRVLSDYKDTLPADEAPAPAEPSSAEEAPEAPAEEAKKEEEIKEEATEAPEVKEEVSTEAEVKEEAKAEETPDANSSEEEDDLGDTAAEDPEEEKKEETA